MLGFLYVFVWPFALGLLSLAGVLFAPRRHLARTATVLALLIVSTSLPLAYGVWTSAARWQEGLAFSSLAVYPVVLLIYLAALLSRCGFIFLRIRR